MTYQFFNPAPVHFDLNGLQPAANGSLVFYDIGTTTPRTTWSDSGSVTPNTNPITLGPDARSPVQIFLDGDYTVVCRDSLGAVVWTRDVVSPIQAGASIPALEDGKFLTNDGSNLLWAELLQIPDPSGSTSHYLTTDGANLLWTQIPEPPDPEVIVTASSFQAGVSDDPTKFLVQMGSGSIIASGTDSASATVNFSTAYSTTPKVFVVPSSNSHSSGPVVLERTAVSVSSFTVRADIAEGFNGDANIVNQVPFDWIAFGNKEIP